MNDNSMLDQAEKELESKGNISDYAPVIVLVFANLAVLFGEVRVYDVIYKLSGEWWKALGSTLSTGIPFILWEIAWQYRAASGLQRGLAIGGAALAFITAVVLGVADFLQGSVYTQSLEDVTTTFLLISVVIALAIHTVLALAFFYKDPKIERERKQRQLVEWYDEQAQKLELANELAKKRKALAATEQTYRKSGGEHFDKAQERISGKKPANTLEKPHSPTS